MLQAACCQGAHTLLQIYQGRGGALYSRQCISGPGRVGHQHRQGLSVCGSAQVANSSCAPDPCHLDRKHSSP